MPKLRVHAFSISLDGYGAGPNSFFAAVPFGFTANDACMGAALGGGQDLWDALSGQFNIKPLLGCNTRHPNGWLVRPSGDIGPTTPVKGWWGDNPPYRPVFVLTSHPRTSIAMDGGTTFHFVTRSPRQRRSEAALPYARARW